MSNDAKEIAWYFLETTGLRKTQAIIVKTIQQAKSLLNAGFTPEEITYGINYFVHTAPPKGGMYSLGFLSVALNQALAQRKTYPEPIYNTIDPQPQVTRGEPTVDNSTSNNQRKVRTNHESRFGEKYNFDLFEKP